jgi:hypothetical protein
MSSYPNLSPKAERHYGASLARFIELLNDLAGVKSQGLDHGAVEARLSEDGNEVLRLGFQGYLDQRSAEEVAEASIIGADGARRTHRRAGCERRLECLFGEVVLRRLGYEGRKLSRVYPLDAALNLSADRYSHGLRAEVAHLALDGSFEAAVETLRRRHGGRVAKRQMQQLAIRLSQDFTAYYARPLAANEESYAPPELLVISVDGKGVVMHTEDLREETRQAAERRDQAAHSGRRLRQAPSAKEKGDRKRMATVAAVYEIAPHARDADAILGDAEASDTRRPKPQFKRVWAGIRETLGEVVGQAFDEALRRDPQHIRTWVVLIDGQEDLIRKIDGAAAAHHQEVFILQDFVHVEEYLWRAAHALYPEEASQKPQREAWIKRRLRQMLQGNAQAVASGLRRAASRRNLGAKEAAPIHKAADYIEKNQQRMCYDIALANGYPIATGVIEGACRHLVKDRMELTGARWRLDDAEAILRLRALKVSGDLDSYLGFHFQQERLRNYPPAPIPDAMPLAA